MISVRHMQIMSQASSYQQLWRRLASAATDADKTNIWRQIDAIDSGHPAVLTPSTLLAAETLLALKKTDVQALCGAVGRMNISQDEPADIRRWRAEPMDCS